MAICISLTAQKSGRAYRQLRPQAAKFLHGALKRSYTPYLNFLSQFVPEIGDSRGSKSGGAHPRLGITLGD